MKKLLATTALIALLTSGVAGLAQAQTATPEAPVATTPSVGQIDQRLENQQKRIDAGVKDGQINAKQEMRDDKADAHVAKELSKDEAKNGGTITKAESFKMNKQLNKNSHRIHRQREKAEAVKASVPVTPAQ
jgi:hypothetical protein